MPDKDDAATSMQTDGENVAFVPLSCGRHSRLAGGAVLSTIIAPQIRWNEVGIVAVRIRMKKMGRKHRMYFRIVAIDGRQPRDGRVLEDLGSYDPQVANTDERAKLKPDRIKYWIGVGAKPSEKCAVLFKKYMKKFEQEALAQAQAAPSS
jgi:small subunit ribosomal protein S16